MQNSPNLKQGFTKALPFITALTASLLSVIQIPIPILGLIRPDLILILIYFWGIYRPQFLPIPLIFIAGLLIDILTSPFIGVNTILYITSFIIVKSQRRFLMAQSFTIQWLCFGLVCTLKTTLQWLLLSMISFMMFPIFDSLILCVFSIILYPFFALILLKIHKKITP